MSDFLRAGRGAGEIANLEDSNENTPNSISSETLEEIRDMMRGAATPPTAPPAPPAFSGDRIALAITVVVFIGSLGSFWASTASRITTIEERQRSQGEEYRRHTEAAVGRFRRAEEKMDDHTDGGHPTSMKAAIDAVAAQLNDLKRRVERLEEK